MEELQLIQALEDDLTLAAVADNLDAGVAIYDAQGNFVFVNTVMINWRNIPRNEYLKKNVHDFTQFIDVCVYDLVCQKKQRVSRLQYYQDIQKVNSPTRMRIVTGTPIFDGDGNIKYVVTMLQDVQSFQTLYHTLLKQTKILSETPLVSESGQAEKTSIVVKSRELRQILSIAESIAPLDSSVLIYGESGSGKEVFAQFIHEHSGRKKKPMITVNCAAFPENLIESELFGYEKGSFTGANKSGKIGLIESADGGTLFLDEINSLPMSIQGKLLRVIEEKNVQRIGALRAKKVDFRLLAATNQDLHHLVQEGRFREDLYYRLSVFPVRVPPLRERRGDIPKLAYAVIDELNQTYEHKKTLSAGAETALLQYDWPGNVRELRNVMERAFIMSDGEEIHAEDLAIVEHGSLQAPTTISPAYGTAAAAPTPPPPAFSPPPGPALTAESLQTQVARFEAALIGQALAETGSLRAAARRLRMDPATLLRRRKKYQQQGLLPQEGFSFETAE